MRNNLKIILAVAAAIAVVILTLGKGSSYKLTDSAYQYYGGSTASISSGAALRRNSDGTTELVQGGHSAETTQPIYLADSTAVVLPDDMLYFAPRSGECRRVVYFTEIERRNNGTIVAGRDGATATIDPGFLYDGEDFYLFLEPVKLTMGGYSMELSALSYVEAVYGGNIIAFNYDTRETFMEAATGEVLAGTTSGDYTISLIGDSMTGYDGSRSLLANRADLFDPLL